MKMAVVMTMLVFGMIAQTVEGLSEFTSSPLSREEAVRYVEAERMAALREISRLEEEIRRYKSMARSTALSQREHDQVKKFKRDLPLIEDYINDLAEGRRFIPPSLPPRGMFIGCIGTLPSGGDGSDYSIRVLKIVDPQSFLLEILLAPRAVKGFNKVLNIVWVRGLPASGMAEGKAVKIDGVFRVAGTDTYTPQSDSPVSVFVLEPVDPQMLRKMASHPGGK